MSIKELKERYKDEQVFVIPFSIVSGIPDKFTRIENEQDIYTKYSNVGKYIFRYDAEGNSALQQLIPYVLIQNEETKEYFVTKRIKGEPRLLEKLSLGFGGHINPCDGTKDPLFRGMTRELMEEAYIEPATKAFFVGYARNMVSNLNDHLGCVFVIRVKNAKVRETENLQGLWMPLEELEKNYNKFENWAKYIIDYLAVNKTF